MTAYPTWRTTPKPSPQSTRWPTPNPTPYPTWKATSKPSPRPTEWPTPTWRSRPTPQPTSKPVTQTPQPTQKPTTSTSSNGDDDDDDCGYGDNGETCSDYRTAAGGILTEEKCDSLWARWGQYWYVAGEVCVEKVDHENA